RIPASVTPNLRIPLFWLSFKNFPFKLYKKLVIQTLKKDGYCCLYFHPWEFTDLSGYKIPKYTRRIDGNELTERLQKFIQELQTQAEFNTMFQFIEERKYK
ncbi:MAG: DUF3473 domain-containing protein, partial [Ferruginibacter sp.]|nr:DUF3473 domain-containing protein [Ferruginibacter sp.]